MAKRRTQTPAPPQPQRVSVTLDLRDPADLRILLEALVELGHIPPKQAAAKLPDEEEPPVVTVRQEQLEAKLGEIVPQALEQQHENLQHVTFPPPPVGPAGEPVETRGLSQAKASLRNKDVSINLKIEELSKLLDR